MVFDQIAQILTQAYTGLGDLVSLFSYSLVFFGALLYGVSLLISDPRTKASYQTWGWGAVLGGIGILLVASAGKWILAALGAQAPAGGSGGGSVIDSCLGEFQTACSEITCKPNDQTCWETSVKSICNDYCSCCKGSNTCGNPECHGLPCSCAP